MGESVSLLMPNRNNAALLDLVLERLAAHTTHPDVELIVVDDGSTDGSREIVRRWRQSRRFQELRLIERDHGGVVEALNTGLAAASGDIVVQLDADATIETPAWVERMLAFFLSDRRIGVLTAKVVFDWGEIHACGIDVVGAAGLHDRGTTIVEPVGRRSWHHRVLRPSEDDCPLCRLPAEVDGGMGCCMMYRREAALELGGYDPGFAPVWFDDLDLALSIRRHGLKAFYSPDVRVVHHVGSRIRAAVPRWRRLARGARWRAGRLLPSAARLQLARRLYLNRPPREQRERLIHHYAYWRRKWGFDLLNPDMRAVEERWGGTEVCWRLDPVRRAAGEEILSAHEARSE